MAGHFECEGTNLAGRTAVGRAIAALDLNRLRLREIREIEILLDRYPPTD
jgi:hypothetical protein